MCGSLSSYRGEGLVLAVETLDMSSRRESDKGGPPSSRRGEGLMPAIETLEMLSG